jgi:phosphocarrier protein
MPVRDLEIVNELGMHARAAAEFTRLAAKFKSGVFVSRDGIEVNGKSIMGVLMLAAYCGSTIAVRAEGDDEDEALDALQSLVEKKFGEEA